MRFFAPIFIWLIFSVCSHAQFGYYKDSEMVQRWDSSTKKAISAINANADGKRIKNDPMLASSFGGKKFGGGSFAPAGKSDTTAPFRYAQKFSSRKYETTRTFFGVKNPWFGRKTYNAGEASLWSKTVLEDDKKYPVEQAETKKAYQSDKTVETSRNVVETKPYLGQPTAQGSVSQIHDKITKEMTVEEVRELLNKNR